MRFKNSIHRITAFTLVMWTTLVLLSFVWNLWQQEATIIAVARVQANAFISKDLSLRSWASSHGGVYVKPTANTPPNPYLKVPNRDVVTTDGMALTLMNPAYITREVHSHFAAQFDVYGHMTSLQLMNPINAPDDWEREGLTQFADGHTDDFTGITDRDGKPYLRLMKPMFMEKSCLACHAWTGLKIGEVRGGIAALVPLTPLREQASDAVLKLALSHGGLWLLGMGGIGWVGRTTSRLTWQHKKSESERRQLYIEATHDALTGLFNRRYMDEILEREVHRSLRSLRPLCLAMIDIDHFKLFNDQHGHKVGDTVLQALGKCLQSGLRRGDVACRYGGEEFAVIMPDAHAPDVKLRLDELTKAIRNLKIVGKHGAVLPPVTVSIGVAESIEASAQDPETLLNLADKALYQAKEQGRDRITFYSCSRHEQESPIDS